VGWEPESLGREAPTSSAHDTIAGQFVVKLRPELPRATWSQGVLKTGETDLDALFRELGATEPERRDPIRREMGSPDSPQGVLTMAFDAELHAVRAVLYAHDGVEWVEPVRRFRPAALGRDPLYPVQWNFESLDLKSLHKITVGRGVTVAILDSGIVPGPDGVANLAPGLDFIDGDEDPTDTDAGQDPNGSHGTHVAGVIAQTTGNGLGGAGLAPGVTILPIRVLGWDEQTHSMAGRSDWIAQAIVWAADRGAAVIHMSFTSPLHSQVVAEACDYAFEKGVTLVAAAGNGAYSNHVDFPASLETVIAVGSSDLNHQLAPYSNQGTALELVAPGGVLAIDADGDGFPDGIGAETYCDGQYGFLLLQGTSQAAAHVSAAAALVRSLGVSDPTQVRDLLGATAFDSGEPGRDASWGHGELDVHAALARQQALVGQAQEPVQP
jgi:serine protease